MDAVYRRMKWLDIDQAVDWLKRLTDKPLTATDLLRLCDSKQCDAYSDTIGLDGVSISLHGCEEISGIAMEKVINPMLLKHAGQVIDEEMGYERPPLSYMARGKKIEHPLTQWVAKKKYKVREALFKPDDILALAARLKPDKGSQPGQYELENIRQELALERARREAAEVEIEELRQRLKDTNTYQQSDEMCDLPEPAGGQPSDQAQQKHDAATPALAFPYATKRLEAMRDAAVKHWVGYTREKRRPTQKEVGLHLGEALGLPRQANGEPAREAKVLAVAIKPEYQQLEI